MENKLVKLYTAQDNLQAEMIINILENNNIPTVKEDLGNAGLMNLYGGNSKYGENIYIRESDVETASQILFEIGLTENP